MKKVSLLDCTLRDGAYIVDGKFGDAAIHGIIDELQEAKVDVIEVGWLKDAEYEKGTSYFHTPEDIKPYLKDKNPDITYVAMIDWDRYDMNNLTPNDGKTIDAIRVVFPKNHYKDAVVLAEPIREKGYKVYFQAANTLGYTEEALVDMVQTVNAVLPESLSVVDTFGAMYKPDLKRIVEIVDKNLNPDIKLGLHSHNNQQLSFGLSMEFVEILADSERELVLDGSLSGMGRGAGNAPTECIATYLNRYCNADYDMNSIMDAIDLYMTHFIENYEWGYSIPYFLAGKYCAHVNNIAYLKKSHRTKNADIKGILESMPEEKRLVYDYDLLEEKYVEYKNLEVDDSETVAELRGKFSNKKALLIAPGESVVKENSAVVKASAEEDVITIGINSVVQGMKYDYLFFSNDMRLKYAIEAYADVLANTDIIITSNVPTDMLDADKYKVYVINFNSIAKRGWVHFDNSGILCVRLLDRLRVEDIQIAGMDGYKYVAGYADGFLRTDIDKAEVDMLNAEISDMIEDFVATHPKTNIDFVTSSIFRDIL